MVAQLQGAQSNLPSLMNLQSMPLSLNSHLVEVLEYQSSEGMIRKSGMEKHEEIK